MRATCSRVAAVGMVGRPLQRSNHSSHVSAAAGGVRWLPLPVMHLLPPWALQLHLQRVLLLLAAVVVAAQWWVAWMRVSCSS